MKLLARIFRPSSAAPAQSFAHSQLMQPEPGSDKPSSKAKRDSTRRELLRMVLRDTLNRQGIPASWLGADALASTSRSGVTGIHWRLVVRHWDPRLLTHSMALQQKLVNRVMALDPLAASWLTGVSWQFALPDESVCPALPQPGTWTASKSEGAAKVAEPTVDIVAGPVRISDPSRPKPNAETAARAELERLLAAREADYQRQSGGDSGPPSQFMRTEPMRLDEAAARAELERLLAGREADFQRRSGSDSAGPTSQFMSTQPMRLE